MVRIGERNLVIRDAAIGAFLTAILVIVAHLVDSFEVLAGWSRDHARRPAGERPTANLSPAFALVVFAWRRPVELRWGDVCRRAEEARRAGE